MYIIVTIFNLLKEMIILLDQMWHCNGKYNKSYSIKVNLILKAMYWNTSLDIRVQWCCVVTPTQHMHTTSLV